MTLKRGIQLIFSTNCIAAVLVSKPVISGIVTRKLMIEPASAIQREVPGWSSRPMASRITPKRIGIQIARERYAMF